jgi:hypothetical protein
MPRFTSSRRPLLPGGLLAAMLAAAPAMAGQGREAGPRPDALVVIPEKIRLGDPREARQLIVTGLFADGAVRDLAHLAAIEPDGSGVVSVESGYVSAKGDGRTSIVVRFEGREVRVPAEVAGFERPGPVSFAARSSPPSTSPAATPGPATARPPARTGSGSA